MAESLTFKPGETVVDKGSKTTHVYRVLTGNLEVHPSRSGKSGLKEGDFFCGVSTLMDQPSTHDIKVSPRHPGNVRCLAWSRENLQSLFSDTEASLDLAKALAQRVVYHMERHVESSLYGASKPVMARVPYATASKEAAEWVVEEGSTQSDVVTLNAGEMLLRERDSGRDIFILRSGTVAISRARTEVTERSQPGEFFGELAALLDIRHSATIKAVSPCSFVRISHAKLLSSVQSSPKFTGLLIMSMAKKVIQASSGYREGD